MMEIREIDRLVEDGIECPNCHCSFRWTDEMIQSVSIYKRNRLIVRFRCFCECMGAIDVSRLVRCES